MAELLWHWLQQACCGASGSGLPVMALLGGAPAAVGLGFGASGRGSSGSGVRRRRRRVGLRWQWGSAPVLLGRALAAVGLSACIEG
jgi:hypothetical protein